MGEGAVETAISTITEQLEAEAPLHVVGVMFRLEAGRPQDNLRTRKRSKHAQLRARAFVCQPLSPTGPVTVRSRTGGNSVNLRASSRMAHLHRGRAIIVPQSSARVITNAHFSFCSPLGIFPGRPARNERISSPNLSAALRRLPRFPRPCRHRRQKDERYKRQPIA